VLSWNIDYSRSNRAQDQCWFWIVEIGCAAVVVASAARFAWTRQFRPADTVHIRLGELSGRCLPLEILLEHHLAQPVAGEYPQRLVRADQRALRAQQQPQRRRQRRQH
jgi:hypothetical protein